MNRTSNGKQKSKKNPLVMTESDSDEPWMIVRTHSEPVNEKGW